MTGLIEVSFTERGHRRKSRCGVRGGRNDEAVLKVLQLQNLKYMSNTTAGSVSGSVALKLRNKL